MTKACIYTALIGGYEQLNEQPIARDSDLDFICFTDNEELESETWKIVHIDPAWPSDRVRSARHLKILGHPFLDQYDSTIWTDNCCVWMRDPINFLTYIESAPMAIPTHAYRETVLDEFNTIWVAGFDSSTRLSEQLSAYLYEDAAILDEKPYHSTIIARRNDPVLAPAMHTWMQHVLRYSRRDQLSLNFALKSAGLPINRVEFDIRDCDWVKWPHTPGRSRTRGLGGSGFTELPPAGVLRHLLVSLEEAEVLANERLRTAEILREELSAMNQLYAGERMDSESQIQELTQSNFELQKRDRNYQRELKLTRKRAAKLENQLRQIRSSRSWRITKPLRKSGK